MTSWEKFRAEEADDDADVADVIYPENNKRMYSDYAHDCVDALVAKVGGLENLKKMMAGHTFVCPKDKNPKGHKYTISLIEKILSDK